MRSASASERPSQSCWGFAKCGVVTRVCLCVPSEGRKSNSAFMWAQLLIERLVCATSMWRHGRGDVTQSRAPSLSLSGTASGAYVSAGRRERERERERREWERRLVWWLQGRKQRGIQRASMNHNKTLFSFQYNGKSMMKYIWKRPKYQLAWKTTKPN